MQKNAYLDSEDEYLVFSASNDDPFLEDRKRSVCIGIELNAKQQEIIKFADDEHLVQKVVGVTCERCALRDCEERAHKASILDQKNRDEEIEKRVYKLINRNSDV
ncbi:MAG: short-chain fatty acyl-CoA regulator family protein [Bacteroidia bacterium]